MALAIDGTTPALASANSGGTVTTASFTPPAGAVLCAVAWHDTASGNTTNTSAVTDSLTLGWTIQATRNRADGGGQNGHVQVSTAVATGAAMTVTTTAINTGGSFASGLYVLVMTGCDTTTPIDVIAESSNTAGVVSLALPATITDLAWGFLAVGDWNVAAAPTAGTNQTAILSTGIGTGPDNRIYLGRQNATTTPAGTVITMSTASPSSGNTNNNIGWAFRPSSTVAAATPLPILATPPAPARRPVDPIIGRGSLVDTDVRAVAVQPVLILPPPRRPAPPYVLVAGAPQPPPATTGAPAPVVVQLIQPPRQPPQTSIVRGSLVDVDVRAAPTQPYIVLPDRPRPQPLPQVVQRAPLAPQGAPPPLLVQPAVKRPDPPPIVITRSPLVDVASASPAPWVVLPQQPRRVAPLVLTYRAPLGGGTQPPVLGPDVVLALAAPSARWTAGEPTGRWATGPAGPDSPWTAGPPRG